MNPRLLELATRHGALKARIEQQRQQLARHAEPLAGALETGDAVLKAADWLKRNPAVVGGSAALLALLRPRRAWRWAKRGFFLWRGWQSLKHSLVNLLNR